MWNIDFNTYIEKLNKPNFRVKDIEPVSPQDLALEKDLAIKTKVEAWILKINHLLRNGYRKYDTTPVAMPNEVLEGLNTAYRAAGWRVTIIRHDKVLTLEFSEA